MDPLSIAASTVTLGGLVQGVGNHIQILVRSRDAPVVLMQISNELADLRVLIGKIEYIYHLSLQVDSLKASDEDAVRNSLDRAKNTILDLEVLTCYKLTKASSSDSLKVERFAWFTNEQKFKSLLERLQRNKHDIAFAIKIDEM